MPRCNHRSIAVATDPRVFVSLAPVTEGDGMSGKTTKITPPCVHGPGKRLLPIHPAHLVGIRSAGVRDVDCDRTARLATVAAGLMAGVVLVRLNPTRKAPAIAFHQILDGFTMLLPCISVGPSSKPGQHSSGGRTRGRSRDESGGVHLDGAVRLDGSRRESIDGGRRERIDGGLVDGLLNDRVDMPLAEVAGEGVREVETRYRGPIHEPGDAHPSASRSRSDKLHLLSAPVLVLVC
jgi:hypothetical protein